MANRLPGSKGSSKMDFRLAIALGAIQGVTEFLPISSDGHLAVAEALYIAVQGEHIPNALGLNIVLHAGTLAAILVVYRQRLIRLLGEDRCVLGLLLVGTLPAIAVGLPLHRWGGAAMTDPLLTGFMLPLTGAILLWGARQPLGELDYRDMGYGRALIIGLFQATALMPGISRSGTTITAALALGLKREAAATFSFLLAVPAVGGACLLELKSMLLTSPVQIDYGPLTAGALSAFVVGLLALAWLLKWLQQGRLHLFAWWCILLGAAVVAWQLATPVSQ
jgi:undecaprenyl-diphosphatase